MSAAGTEVTSVTFGNSSLRRMLGMTLSGRYPLSSVEALIDPVTIIGSLWAIVWYEGLPLNDHWLVLSVLLLLLTFPSPAFLRFSVGHLVRQVIAGWLVLMSVLFGTSALVAWLTDSLPLFEEIVLIDWLWLAPLAQLGGHLALRMLAPSLRALEPERCAIIAGATIEGARLAIKLLDNPYGRTQVMGYFDDRSGERIAEMPVNVPCLGKLSEMPTWIQDGRANVVYIALPLAAQARINILLEALRSSTAQVYFVPDALVIDLLRGWCDVVGDAPVVAMLESPFDGINGWVKRSLDLIIGSVLFVLTLPLLLLLMMLVKAASSGPAIVTQRRYGLDGGEFRLYALRDTAADKLENALGDSMPPNNAVSHFLRNTHLEKLPRLINILQGRLSLVGPRPHAKAHNEIYRRIVKGHLIRHRIPCGLTGWAQINGVRGGVKSLDHMKARVNHDLEYLRHWSLRLDLQIMLRAIANLFALLFAKIFAGRA